MSLRPTEEPFITDARAKLAQARADLAAALETLEAEAKTAARTARSKSRRVSLDRVYAAELDVRRAEEAVDFAVTDLASSSGEDV